MRVRWPIAALALACAIPLADAGAQDTPAACAPEIGTTHAVVRVLDGETLLLDDGQEVRLSGVLAPHPESLRVTAEDWPPAREAKSALAALVEGRTVALRYDGRRRDRYGRILAHVVVQTPDGAVWVQESLIASGHARASALRGEAACLRELMRVERNARANGLGLWRQAIYAVERAENVTTLLRRAGRFMIVEGKVASVTHARQETFINFGADWRRDFTASLPIKIVDETTGAREHLTALAGTTIRVRGWIERRNGPMIHLSALDEIEEVGGPAEASR